MIVLNKMDLLSADEAAKLADLLRHLNPSARLITSTFSRVPLHAVLGTKLFNMETARTHAGWMQELAYVQNTCNYRVLDNTDNDTCVLVVSMYQKPSSTV